MAFVGAAVGGFEFACRLVMAGRAVVEAAVSEWHTESLVEEQEEQATWTPFAVRR
jgi:hypothetical protein